MRDMTDVAVKYSLFLSWINVSIQRVRRDRTLRLCYYVVSYYLSGKKQKLRVPVAWKP